MGMGIRKALLASGGTERNATALISGFLCPCIRLKARSDGGGGGNHNYQTCRLCHNGRDRPRCRGRASRLRPQNLTSELNAPFHTAHPRSPAHLSVSGVTVEATRRSTKQRSHHLPTPTHTAIRTLMWRQQKKRKRKKFIKLPLLD